MGNLRAINDKTTNPILVHELERMLEAAKAGDLDGLMWVSFDSDGTNSGWALPHRMDNMHNVMGVLLSLAMDIRTACAKENG